MQSNQPMTFEEYESFFNRVQQSARLDSTSIAALPTTEAMFSVWWRQISVSDELRERWIKRIRLTRNDQDFPVENTGALRKAA